MVRVCYDVVLSLFVLVSVRCLCFFKQKTAYEMRISDWSSDVCSSDLVAAVAFGQHVLAQGRDGLARDDAAADRRLDGDLEHLPRDEILEPLAQGPAPPLRLRPVDDHRQRVHRLGIHQDGHLPEELGRASCRERVGTYGSI